MEETNIEVETPVVETPVAEVVPEVLDENKQPVAEVAPEVVEEEIV